MGILVIIGWVFLILIGLIVLLYLIALYLSWQDDILPKGMNAHIESRVYFSYEMCEIVGKKNRGEITEKQKKAALKEAYFKDKILIDIYERIAPYPRIRTESEFDTPTPVIASWSQEFVDNIVTINNQTPRPGFIAIWYDKNLRKYF